MQNLQYCVSSSVVVSPANQLVFSSVWGADVIIFIYGLKMQIIIFISRT